MFCLLGCGDSCKNDFYDDRASKTLFQIEERKYLNSMVHSIILHFLRKNEITFHFQSWNIQNTKYVCRIYFNILTYLNPQKAKLYGMIEKKKRDRPGVIRLSGVTKSTDREMLSDAIERQIRRRSDCICIRGSFRSVSTIVKNKRYMEIKASHIRKRLEE